MRYLPEGCGDGKSCQDRIRFLAEVKEQQHIQNLEPLQHCMLLSAGWVAKHILAAPPRRLALPGIGSRTHVPVGCSCPVCSRLTFQRASAKKPPFSLLASGSGRITRVMAHGCCRQDQMPHQAEASE